MKNTLLRTYQTPALPEELKLNHHTRNPNLQSAHQTNETKEKNKRKKRNQIYLGSSTKHHIRQAERRRNRQQEWQR
jgi:hypothetical protein